MAAAAAEALVRAGARVLVTSRTPADGAALVERLVTIGDTDSARFHRADLQVEADADAVVTEATRDLGRVDGLLHVAGGSGRRYGDGPLHELTLDGWEATFRLNLTTQFLLTRAVVRAMLAQSPSGSANQRGSILLVTSILGFHPAPSHFATHAYAAAKGAVTALVTTMAANYAPTGIRVNSSLRRWWRRRWPRGPPPTPRRWPIAPAAAAADRRDAGAGRGRPCRGLLPVRRVAGRDRAVARGRRRVVGLRCIRPARTRAGRRAG